MEEVIDACETLADTGNNQLLIIGGALLLVTLAASWLLTGRKVQLKFMVAALGIVFGFSLLMAPVVTYAQSVPDECIEQSEDEQGGDEDSEPAAVLGLVDDAGVMQVPDNDQMVLYLAILGNDTAPDDDPIDWDTVDLDPETVGLQTSIDLPHPDDADFSCGTISAGTFGVLQVALQDPCYDTDFNDLAIPSDFTIAPFTYTVQTVGAVQAPAPATVTITTQTEAPEQIVYADSQNVCTIFGPATVDLTNGATTSAGSIDPASVDLNPSLPGQQTSITLPGDNIITVDSSGTASVPEGVSGGFYYTISNTNGTISNINYIGFDTSCV
jgi:hypothetical protein